MIYPKEWKQKRVENGHMVQRMLGFGGMVLALAGILLAGLNLYANETSLGNITLTGTSASETVTLSESGTQVIMAGDVVCDSSLIDIDIDIDIDSVTHYAFVEVEDDSNTPDNSAETTVTLSDIGTNKTLELPGTEGAYTLYLGDSKSDDSYLGEYSVYVIAEMEAPTLTVTYQESGTFGRMTTSGTTMLVAGDKIDQPSDTSTYTYEYAFTTMNSVPSSSADVPTTGISVANTSNTYLYIEQTFTDTTDEDITRSEGYFYPIEVRSVPTQTLTDVDAKDLTTYASSNTTLNYILADSELTSTIGGGTTGDTFQYEWSGDESTAPTSWKSSSITADMTTITTTGVTDTSYLHIQVVTPAISNGGYLNQRTLLSEVFCIEEVTVSEPTVTLTHTSFSTTEDGTLNGTVTLEQNSETLYGAGDTFTITDSETNATVAYLLSESEIVEDNAVFANAPSAVSIETGMTHLHIRTTISGISKDFTYPLTEIILEEATVTYNEVDINADSTTSINTSYTPNPSVTISTQESSSNGFRYQVSSGNSSSTLARGTTGKAIPITPTTGTTYLYIQDTQTIDSTTVYWPIKQYTFTFVENISQATLRDSSGEALTSNSTLSNGGDILGFVSQTDSDGVVYLVGSADNTIGIASEVTSLDNLTGYTQVLGTTVVSHGGDYYLQDVDGYHKITSNQDLTTIQLYTDTDTGFVVGELIGNSVSISAITLGDNSTTANSGVAQYTLTIGAYTPDSPDQVTTSIFQTDSGSDTIILANDSTTAVIAGNTITIKDDDIDNTNAIGTKYTWSMSSDSSVDSTTLFYVDATSSGVSATLTIPSYIGDYNLYLKKVKYNTTSGVAIAEELYTYPLGIQTLPVITLKNEDHLANLDSDGEMMTNGMNTVVAGETISFAQTGADALVSSTVSYRYAFTDTQVTSSDLLDGIVVESQEKMTVPVEASYLYVQIYDKTDGISKWLDPVEYKLQYMQQMSPVVLSIMTKSVNATGGDEVGMIQAVSYGTEITLQTVPSNSIILYMQSDTISPTNSFDIEEQEVTDGDLITRLESLNGTSGYKNLVGLEDVYYVKRGITWCQLQPTQGLELKEYDDGNLPTYLLNEGSTDKDIYIAFISGQSDAQPSEVVRYAVTATARSLVTTPTSVTGSDITATQYVQLAVLNQTTTYYTMGYDTDGITNISQLADPTTSSTVYDTATGILSWAGEIGDTVPSKLYVKAFSVDNTGTKLDSNVASFTYDIGGLGTVADPTAFPTTYTDSQTIVNPGQSIIIWSTTPDATIYYTTSEDNHKTTYTYSGGIEVPLSESGYFEVKAIAKKAGMNDSNQMTFSYQLPAAVSPPYVTPSAGSVELNTEVSLGTTTEGGSIYYEIAYGSTPVDPSTSSPIYDESQTFVITQDTTIKAMTVKDGVPSTVVTFNFTPMAQIELPTASITSGSTVARGTVITFHGADGATIYYTTDGSDPSEVGNSMVTTGTSFMIDGEAGEMVTVKLYAKLSGNSSSEIATYTYLISQYSGGVSSDVESGSKIPRSTIVNLTTDLLDATLYYTLDGSEPTTTSASGTTIDMSQTTDNTVVVKAVAMVPGGSSSLVTTFVYYFNEIANAPTISPAGGELTVATYATISATSGTIYYTTDGTTLPSMDEGILYEEAILVNQAMTIKAVSVSEDGEYSPVTTVEFTLAEQASTPTSSQRSGTIESGTEIALETTTPDATIYYSTDGTVPTGSNLSELLEYTLPISVSHDTYIQAVTYVDEMRLSSVATFSYEVDTIEGLTNKEIAEALLQEDSLQSSDLSKLPTKYEELTQEGNAIYLEDWLATTFVIAEAGVIPTNTSLESKEYTSSKTAISNVQALLGAEYTILESYDMNLYAAGSRIEPDGEVLIQLYIPEGYDNANLVLAYVNDENQIQLLETFRVDGKLCAYVTHFSVYAIVGMAQSEQVEIHINIAYVLATIAGMVVVSYAIFRISHLISGKKAKMGSKYYPNE